MNEATPTQEAPRLRVRRRSGTLLFRLDRSEICDRDAVLFDHFDVRAEAPITFTSRDARDEWIDGTAGPHVDPSLLERPRRSRNGRVITLPVAPGWHFTGNVELRLDAEGLGGRVVVALALNFTRWAADLSADDVSALVGLSQDETFDPTPLLQRGPRRRCASLDGADNVLPNRDRGGQPSLEPRVAHADTLLSVLLDAVHALFSAHLAPENSDAPGVRIGDLSFAPSYAEAYLEFYADDAVSVIEGLRSAAQRAAPNASWREFVGKSIGGGMVRNAPTIVIPLTKTVEAVLYAKKSRLIRCEIRYRDDLREQSHHRDQRGRSASVLEILVGLKTDAANRLQRLFRGFAMHLNRTRSRADLFDFLSAVHRAAGDDPARARDLLSVLGNTGGVTATDEDGVAPSSTIRHLTGAGVLVRHAFRHGNADRGEPVRYALAPAFADMLSRLVARADGLPPPLPLSAMN